MISTIRITVNGACSAGLRIIVLPRGPHCTAASTVAAFPACTVVMSSPVAGFSTAYLTFGSSQDQRVLTREGKYVSVFGGVPVHCDKVFMGFYS